MAGGRLFVIEVQQSSTEVLLGGKVYVRTGVRTTLKQAAPATPLTEPGIERLRTALADDRQAMVGARSVSGVSGHASATKPYAPAIITAARRWASITDYGAIPPCTS